MGRCACPLRGCGAGYRRASRFVFDRHLTDLNARRGTGRFCALAARCGNLTNNVRMMAV